MTAPRKKVFIPTLLVAISVALFGLFLYVLEVYSPRITQQVTIGEYIATMFALQLLQKLGLRAYLGLPTLTNTKGY